MTTSMCICMSLSSPTYFALSTSDLLNCISMLLPANDFPSVPQISKIKPVFHKRFEHKYLLRLPNVTKYHRMHFLCSRKKKKHSILNAILKILVLGVSWLAAHHDDHISFHSIHLSNTDPIFPRPHLHILRVKVRSTMFG